MHYCPFRHFPRPVTQAGFVRLACLIHAANVHSEPGSNPSKNIFASSPGVTRETCSRPFSTHPEARRGSRSESIHENGFDVSPSRLSRNRVMLVIIAGSLRRE